MSKSQAAGAGARPGQDSYSSWSPALPNPRTTMGNSTVVLGVPFVVNLVDLIAMATYWRGTSLPEMIGCLILLGSTTAGNFIANFTIAPMLAGYISHDTAQWNKLVVAASAAAAGVAMLCAAGTVVLSTMRAS